MGPDPSGGFTATSSEWKKPVANSLWLAETLQHLVSRTPDAALTTYTHHVRRTTQGNNPLQPVAASREEPKPLARRLWSAGRRLPNDGSPPGMDPGSHPLRGFARGNEKAACSGWLAACSQQNACGLRPAPDKARSLGGGLGRILGVVRDVSPVSNHSLTTNGHVTPTPHNRSPSSPTNRRSRWDRGSCRYPSPLLPSSPTRREAPRSGIFSCRGCVDRADRHTAVALRKFERPIPSPRVFKIPGLANLSVCSPGMTDSGGAWYVVRSR